MVFYGLVLLSVLLCDVHGIITPAELEQQMKNTIIPSYVTAYNTLNAGIVQRLLDADPSSDQDTIQILVDGLVCSAKKVHGNLDKAAQYGEMLRRTVDEQVIDVTQSVTNQEQHVHQSQMNFDQARHQLVSAEEQLRVAESAVHDSQNALNSANNAVEEAKKSVSNAKVCGFGRRRKRFLRGFIRELNPVRIFRNTFGEPFCRLVNNGGIKNAEDRRSIAEHNLREAQQRLNSRREILTDRQTESCKTSI